MPDLLEIQQAYANALSPLTNYTQGLMAVALQRRAREEQLSDRSLLRQQQLQDREVNRAQQLEDIKAEQDFRERLELSREKAANDRIIAQIKAQFAESSKAQREAKRDELVTKAREMGSNISRDASFDTALSEYVTLQGKRYITANRRAGAAVAGISRSMGRQLQESMARQAVLVADSDIIAKVLTPAEREPIRTDPSKMVDLRTQYSITDKKKYNALSTAMAEAAERLATDVEATAKAEGREDAVALAQEMRSANQMMFDLRKEMNFSPDVEDEAFRVYQEAARPPQPATPVPKVRPKLPPQLLRGAAPVAPVPPGAFRAQPVAPGVLPAPSAAAAPPPYALQSNQMLVDPERARLNRYIQDQTLLRGSTTPTAFPLVPVPVQ